MKPSPTDEDPKYRVQAVEKALALMGAFNHNERELSLADLSTRAGVPRPTAFRLLSTLENAGFVRRVGSNYALGFRCFVLGNIVKEDLVLEREAAPFLTSLRDVTGETVQLAMLVDWQVVYLARVRSPQPVAYMKSRVGAILPAYCTGLGKALLAALPRDEVAEWSRTQQFRRLTPNTISSRAELLAELDKVRACGHAVDDEEREPGVRCIAAAVVDDTGAPIGAISVAGPADRMPAQLMGSEMAQHVVSCAASISERMGYVPSGFQPAAASSNARLR